MTTKKTAEKTIGKLKVVLHIDVREGVIADAKIEGILVKPAAMQEKIETLLTGRSVSDGIADDIALFLKEHKATVNIEPQVLEQMAEELLE